MDTIPHTPTLLHIQLSIVEESVHHWHNKYHHQILGKGWAIRKKTERERQFHSYVLEVLCVFVLGSERLECKCRASHVFFCLHKWQTSIPSIVTQTKADPGWYRFVAVPQGMGHYEFLPFYPSCRAIGAYFACQDMGTGFS